MSQVLGSFRSSLGIAVGAPAHALVAATVMLVALAIGAVLSFIPLVGPMVSSIVISPLMLAAVLGSANAARHGESVVEGLKRGVSESGVSLIGAYGLVYAVVLGVSLVLGIGIVVVLMFTVGIGSAVDPSVGTLFSGVFGILLLVFFLVFFALGLLGAFAIMFVGPAAVVAGTGAVDSLKTSYRFFRQNVLGVLGFSAVVFALTIVAYVPAVAGFAIGFVAASELAAWVLAGVGYLLAFAVLAPVLTIYQVEYFDRVVDASVLPATGTVERQPTGTTVTGVGTETESGSAPASDDTAFDFGDHDDGDVDETSSGTHDDGGFDSFGNRDADEDDRQ
jgi:hypothetical protein